MKFEKLEPLDDNLWLRLDSLLAVKFIDIDGRPSESEIYTRYGRCQSRPTTGR